MFKAKARNVSGNVFSVEKEVDVIDSLDGKYSMKLLIDDLNRFKSDTDFEKLNGDIDVSTAKVDLNNDFAKKCLEGFFNNGGRFEGYVTIRKGLAFYNGELNPCFFAEDYEYEPKKFHLISKIEEVEVLLKHNLSIFLSRK
jgi:hypothetical protein